MDPQVSASFIPKKPLADTRSRGASGGLLTLLAVLIFVASIIAAGGSFLYGRYLTSSLESKKTTLDKYQQAYDLPTIKTLIRFDTRITEAHKVLNAHLAPSAIFAFLSEQTLERVQFKDFTFTIGSVGHDATIQMSGVTDSFATIALQSDRLGGTKVLKNIIFSGISIQEAGKVTFSVTADIDPALILYSNSYNVDQTSALVPIEAPIATSSVPQ